MSPIINSLRNFQFSLVKAQFFSRGASPPEPPSKESKQISDNIAYFYNLTLPIIKSDEIYNAIYCCIHKGVVRNIICVFVGTNGVVWGRTHPVAEGENVLRVNKPPLDKE